MAISNGSIWYGIVFVVLCRNFYLLVLNTSSFFIIVTGMNYYLAVIPFLGAVEAGLFGQLQYEIEILPPEERRADFCYSVADCRSHIPKLMDDWKAYFEVNNFTFFSYFIGNATRISALKNIILLLLRFRELALLSITA